MRKQVVQLAGRGAAGAVGGPPNACGILVMQLEAAGFAAALSARVDVGATLAVAPRVMRTYTCLAAETLFSLERRRVSL